MTTTTKKVVNISGENPGHAYEKITLVWVPRMVNPALKERAGELGNGGKG